MTSNAFALLAVVALVALAVPAGGVGAGSRAAVSVRDDLERAILADVNAIRLRHGLRPLRPTRPLAAAARRHSLEMARRGFFGHESVGGIPFWRRIARLYGARGYSRWSVGETLLWRSPDLDSSSQAIRLWLSSPTHRRILLDPAWVEVGLAAVHTEAAPGVFSGLPVTIVTADFGLRVR